MHNAKLSTQSFDIVLDIGLETVQIETVLVQRMENLLF